MKAVTTKLVNGLKDLYDEKEQLIAKEKAGMYKSIWVYPQIEYLNE